MNSPLIDHRVRDHARSARPRPIVLTLPWLLLGAAMACSSNNASLPPGSIESGSGASAGDSSGGTSSGQPNAGSDQGADTGASSGQGRGAATGSGSGAAASGLMTLDSGGSPPVGEGGVSDASSGNGRTGKMSGGCGMAPSGDTSTQFSDHKISIAACAACVPPNCPSNCIAPPWVPGGTAALTAADGENYLDRDFTVKLPPNYQPTTAYPVFYGGNGCGVPPPQTGAGYGIGETGAIEVGLQYVGTCFADGGTSCAKTVANEPLCVNGPELPYFNAVQNWVEAHYCVDMGNEFIGGGSSGAWEALTVGCGDASTLRGSISVAGGKREHRWPCTGPIAAFMIVADDDTNNPVGPLTTINTELDSYGAVPARDDLLQRNGCIGTNTAVLDPAYPECKRYTGCPAAYPVVWCEFPSGGHDNPSFNGINYTKAMWPFLMGLPPAP